uniref:Uncharacterized protein n=1 Tax=Arundo donax TaxID=35708 RepID=A0A0A9H2F0_ARUDO
MDQYYCRAPRRGSPPHMQPWLHPPAVSIFYSLFVGLRCSTMCAEQSNSNMVDGEGTERMPSILPS